MTGASIVRWQAGDAVVLAVHGAFDGASAWALRLEMEESPAREFLVDLTHAVEMYQRAIQRGADTSSAYSNLANAYYRLKRLDEAVNPWRRALEIDPANQKAATALERLGIETRPK